MRPSLACTSLISVLLLTVATPSRAESLSGENVFRTNQDRVHLIQLHYEDQVLGSGSSFVASYGGKNYLITNHHVISIASIYIEHDGNRIDDVEILRVNESRDIAILSFAGIESRPAIELESYIPEQGERVYAMGYPSVPDTRVSGLTITDGLVSNRDLRVSRFGSENQFVQISAALNGGNSGGPVFGSRGNLVGMATAVYPDMQATNVAVPTGQIIEEINRLNSRARNRAEAEEELRERFAEIAKSVSDDAFFRFGAYYAPEYKLDIYPEVLRSASRVARAHNMLTMRGYEDSNGLLSDMQRWLRLDEYFFYRAFLGYHRALGSETPFSSLIFSVASFEPIRATELYLSGRFYYVMFRESNLPQGRNIELKSYEVQRLTFDDDLRNAEAEIIVEMAHGSFPLRLRFRHEWGNWFLLPSYDYRSEDPQLGPTNDPEFIHSEEYE